MSYSLLGQRSQLGHDWMNKFKKKLLLGSSEQLSVKYFPIFLIFMKIFLIMSDTTLEVSRMEWVKKNDPYGIELLLGQI